jgi:hypothetical protein
MTEGFAGIKDDAARTCRDRSLATSPHRAGRALQGRVVSSLPLIVSRYLAIQSRQLGLQSVA